MYHIQLQITPTPLSPIDFVISLKPYPKHTQWPSDTVSVDYIERWVEKYNPCGFDATSHKGRSFLVLLAVV